MAASSCARALKARCLRARLWSLIWQHLRHPVNRFQLKSGSVFKMHVIWLKIWNKFERRYVIHPYLWYIFRTSVLIHTLICTDSFLCWIPHDPSSAQFVGTRWHSNCDQADWRNGRPVVFLQNPIVQYPLARRVKNRHVWPFFHSWRLNPILGVLGPMQSRCPDARRVSDASTTYG